MSQVLDRYPELNQASASQKLELIDELWESIRRSGEIAIPQTHLDELGRRLAEVKNDPSLALVPAEARAFLRSR